MTLNYPQCQIHIRPLRARSQEPAIPCKLETVTIVNPLSMTTSRNQVNITTGIVNTTMSNAIYRDNHLTVYQVDKMLLLAFFLAHHPPSTSSLKLARVSSILLKSYASAMKFFQQWKPLAKIKVKKATILAGRQTKEEVQRQWCDSRSVGFYREKRRDGAASALQLLHLGYL
ncbi:fasciclin-like arabinogalactan protein 11 [Sesbania bispinosa]|nr:fasciclin-like arabinogalactan protein 11 [Sesbania bispinosa]